MWEKQEEKRRKREMHDWSSRGGAQASAKRGELRREGGRGEEGEPEPHGLFFPSSSFTSILFFLSVVGIYNSRRRAIILFSLDPERFYARSPLPPSSCQKVWGVYKESYRMNHIRLRLSCPPRLGLFDCRSFSFRLFVYNMDRYTYLSRIYVVILYYVS